MRRFWCELAWLGGDRAVSGVVLSIDGDRILAVEEGAEAAPPDATALKGLTLPALANTHSHVFHRALRGRTHERSGSFWTWRDLMYRVAAALDPDSLHRLARAVFAEMTLAGVGVVGEFHYVHHSPDGTPHGDPNAMGAAIIDAARDAGIRLTLLDTLYLSGGFCDTGGGGVTHMPLSEHQRRFGDGSFAAWAERLRALMGSTADPTVRIGAAVHSVRAVEPADIERAAAFAREHRIPLHVHASEQPAENTQCLATHGVSPIGLLDRCGALGPGTTLVHATHVSDQDIEAVARSGAGVCLCPTTELDLADGIGPSETLLRAGVNVSLGSDSHAVVDLVREARSVELHQRALAGRRGVHDTAELATMATSAGYRSLGWADGGRLEAGAPADFTTVGLDSVRLAGADPESALDAVFFAADASDVRSVVVAGRLVVIDGRHVHIDVAGELAEAIEAVVRP